MKIAPVVFPLHPNGKGERLEQGARKPDADFLTDDLGDFPEHIVDVDEHSAAKEPILLDQDATHLRHRRRRELARHGEFVAPHDRHAGDSLFGGNEPDSRVKDVGEGDDVAGQRRLEVETAANDCHEKARIPFHVEPHEAVPFDDLHRGCELQTVGGD